MAKIRTNKFNTSSNFKKHDRPNNTTSVKAEKYNETNTSKQLTYPVLTTEHTTGGNQTKSRLHTADKMMTENQTEENK